MMKIINKQSYLGFYLLCITMVMISCNNWIEVEPKTQIENDRFFSDPIGFEEALNGVYIKMSTPALYGKELSFGLLDVMGGMYSLASNAGSLTYRQASSGDYQSDGPLGVISGVWENSYNAIANLNNLIDQLEKADPSMFDEGQYEVLKGEALGLRAFLHFDLLRIYTQSYVVGGGTSDGVPYVTEYAPVVTPRSTVENTVEAILDDLADAEVLLAETDPISTETGQLPERKTHFNYYAVKATKARVFLWKGDKEGALEEATAVIENAAVKFPFVAQSSIATGNESARDRVFTTENIFMLEVPKIAQYYAGILDTTLRFTTSLGIRSSQRNTQYETSTVGITDYRNVYLLRDLSSYSPGRIFFGKLYQPNGIPAAYAEKVPLIKIPEMYYIAAECLKETDPGQAMEYLNAVRNARGITADLTGLTSVQIQDELRKEYWKEMPSEGQMFFYYKRNNSTSIPGISGSYASARYVLPLPQREIDFGS